MTVSADRYSSVAPSTPTTAGIPRDRAVIAVWDVRLPTSVAKPSTGLFRIWAVSAGERSWATMTTGSRIAATESTGRPARFSRTRWPIWRRSCPRSLRYGSSIRWNVSRRFWSTLLNAQSAANWFSRIVRTVSSTIIESSRRARWTERIWWCSEEESATPSCMRRICSRERATALWKAATSSSTCSRPTVERTDRGRTRFRKNPFPIATPPEAGIPLRIRIFKRPSVTFLLLPEFRGDQLPDRRKGLFRIRPVRADQDLRILRRREHQDAHDAFPIDLQSVLREADLGEEPVRQAHQLSRGAGVQAEPVQDVELAFRAHRHRINTPTKRRNKRISDGETAFRNRIVNRCATAAARRKDATM